MTDNNTVDAISPAPKHEAKRLDLVTVHKLFRLLAEAKLAQVQLQLRQEQIRAELGEMSRLAQEASDTFIRERKAAGDALGVNLEDFTINELTGELVRPPK